MWSVWSTVSFCIRRKNVEEDTWGTWLPRGGTSWFIHCWSKCNNTRIDRLWKDYYTAVTTVFGKIFIELERNNDADLLCLHLACTIYFCHDYTYYGTEYTWTLSSRWWCFSTSTVHSWTDDNGWFGCYWSTICSLIFRHIWCTQRFIFCGS